MKEESSVSVNAAAEAVHSLGVSGGLRLGGRAKRDLVSDRAMLAEAAVRFLHACHQHRVDIDAYLSERSRQKRLLDTQEGQA